MLSEAGRCRAHHANGCRTSCCRSSRRGCSGCEWRDRGRRSGDAPRRAPGVCRASCPAARARACSRRSISSTLFMYFEQSMMTATLHHLPGERRAAAARRNRHTVLAADADGLDHVVVVTRNDHADRHLPVVRSIGRSTGPDRRLETGPRHVSSASGRPPGLRRPHAGDRTVRSGASPTFWESLSLSAVPVICTCPSWKRSA